jgi:two-component system, chemotaxis family, sensor kinase CheA
VESQLGRMTMGGDTLVEMDAELLREFLNESWDNLEQLDRDFVELEQKPGDMQIITRIFRVIHTMKGCSGLLGYRTLEEISHYAEDILSQMREGTRPVEERVITKLLKVADVLKEILQVVEKTQAEGDKDQTPLIEELKAIASESKPQAQSKPTKSAPTPPATKTTSIEGARSWQVTIFLDDEEKMPSVRGLVVAERLAGLGKIEDLIPDVRNDEELHSGEGLVAILSTTQTQEIIQNAAMGTSVQSVTVEPFEEISVQSVTPVAGETQGVVQQELPETGQPETGTRVLERAEKVIRVDIEIIDQLMNLVGELVLSRNQIMQFSHSIENTAFSSACHRISLVTSELQEKVMKTRMQPIANVFNRFPRMIRDLAADFGKQVDLRINGKETELDRTLIEAIKDPMVHLLRNSMDHGIESPEERQRKGKPACGNLLISAFHENGQVNIVVKDDGAGVDTIRVKEIALKRGLISQPQVETMSDREAMNLIFMPGFSTAKAVTNVSGRGVGMDVVRTNIEKIGGTVEIQSEKGLGTTITVKIPLTLAIIPALLVTAGGQRFAIPQVSLFELVCLEGDQIHQEIENVRNVEVFRLRGELLPLIRLQEVLGLSPNGQTQDTLYIVVLRAGSGQVGLIIDQVHDTEEIVVKPLSRHVKQLAAFAGATILGDGQVALILDVQGLVTLGGVQSEQIDRDLVEARDHTQTRFDDTQSTLLFRLGAEDQYAIPLGLVNRLEEIDKAGIEVASGQEVIQYRGDVLPLIRPEKYLQTSVQTSQQTTLPVIVFVFEDKQAGLVVSEILDITDIKTEFSRTNVGGNGILGTAIFDGKTTQFVDIYRILEMALPHWFGNSTVGAESQGVSILLVDDSPFYRTMVSAYIKAAGMNCIEAAHGREALDLLEQYKIDLVLTDLLMPEMNGFDLIQNIRDQEVFQDLPVVALTSSVDPMNRERALRLGANAYLIKLNRDELLKTVDVMLTTGIGEKG